MAKHSLQPDPNRLTVSYSERRDETSRGVAGRLVVLLSLRNFDILNTMSTDLIGVPLMELYETNARQAYLIARMGLERIWRQHAQGIQDGADIAQDEMEMIEQNVQALLAGLPDHLNASFDMEIGIYPSVQDAWVFDQDLSRPIELMTKHIPMLHKKNAS